MRGIRANYPEALDLIAQYAFDNPVVCPAIFSRDDAFVDTERRGNFLAMGGVLEIVSTQ